MTGRIRHPFRHNSDPGAEILILGTMPSVESMRRAEYYAHPRNAFWRIMGEAFGFPSDAPYEERLAALRKNKVALWDVVGSCVRPGSLDSDIRDVTPNDFEAFFKARPKIRRILFNGQAARTLFLRHTKGMGIPDVPMIVLPSTSPANAGTSHAEKLSAWRDALRG